jgi:hypothetical protein
MKKLCIVAVILMLTGCMTANQLEAEKAFYQMLMAKQAQTTPLVRLDVADPTKPINLKTIEVFAPPSNTPIAQYTQKDYVQPWLNVFSMAVPWLGAWGITSSVTSAMKDMGNTNMNITGTGNSGSIIGPTHNAVTGTGNYTGGTVDTTHTPTVVNPTVVVVEPSYPPK